MKNILKKQKGITLIALVVTIIILVILAAVTINLVIGNNGILQKAKGGTEKYTIASYEEELNLKLVPIKTNIIASDKQLNMSNLVQELGKEIEENGLEEFVFDVEEQMENEEPSGIYKEYNFYIDKDYKAHVTEKNTAKYVVSKFETKGYSNSEVKISFAMKNAQLSEITEPQGITKNDDGTYSATENGEYIFTIKDIENNVYTKKVVVNKIDRFSPICNEIKISEYTDSGFDVIMDFNDKDSSNKNAESGIDRYEIYINGNKVGESKEAKYTTDGLQRKTDYTVKVIAFDKVGNQTESQEIIARIDIVYSNIEGKDLIFAVENIAKSGYYNIKVNNTEYKAHAYVLDGNQTWSENKTFGDSEDVATASEYAKHMVIVKVNGDLTIAEGSTVTAYASTAGYGGPKGMFVYCTGTLTNNGTISMTARGAKAEGQDVYLFKNQDNSYEYVPAVGAPTRPGLRSYEWTQGVAGYNGTLRQTRKWRNRYE